MRPSDPIALWRESMPLALPAWPGVLKSRSLRLWSGCVLGLFLLCHLSNLALGLVSVRAMEAASPVLMRPWAGAIGGLLLGGALLVHFSLSLRVLYRRRTLHMSLREGVQLGLGLCLPFLIIAHVVAVRIEPALTGVPTTFTEQLRALWVMVPFNGARQALALVVGWTHACVGLWFWLRTRAWFPRWSGLLQSLSLLIPVLALLGFAEAGREIAARPDIAQAVAAPEPVSRETLRLALTLGLAAAIGAVLMARALRRWRGRHRRIRIHYPEGRIVTVAAGFTVLEASRIGQVPHVALCGGRGRCSTCRIRVLGGGESLPAPSVEERTTLLRSGVAADIRLACQLRPTHDVAIMPVFAAARPRTGGAPPRRGAASHERELAVLFCDLRGFTHRAERWLPFDTVFMLNRYFEMVGRAVEDAGGFLDKFIGDGALALFGLNSAPDVACRQALAAASGIARGLQAMNAEFAAELDEPLRIAMGLHAGAAIVGDMGYGNAVGLTAVGDGINVASRLEGEAKERDVEAVVSIAVLKWAQRPVNPGAVHRIVVRGRVAPVEAVLVVDASTLVEDIPVTVQARDFANEALCAKESSSAATHLK